jgi:adenylate cyclase
LLNANSPEVVFSAADKPPGNPFLHSTHVHAGGKGQRHFGMINRLRLASGLAMLAYVTMHLINHAIGLVSLGSMERMLLWVSGLWSLPPMQLLLYGSFSIHYALALLALWQRRSVRLPATELLRVGLGFAIPILLLRHAVTTRLAHTLFGTNMGQYTYLLWVYFVRSPATGFQQLLVLVVAWTHAMLGLHFWFKVRPWYARLQSPALVFAILVPVLSLLGAIEAGRQVAALAAEPGWIGAAFSEMMLPTKAAERSLSFIVESGTWFFLAAVALVLIARLLRRLWQRRLGMVRITYPDGRYIEVTPGMSVLEASRLAGVPHASICGGRGRCSTCRVRVRGTAHSLEPPTEGERRVLCRIRATPNVRLACMLRPTGPVEVTPLLPPLALAGDGQRPIDLALGREREIAILFADIRGFTALSENRLPYDVVFILNRYFAMVGRAVETAGGRIDKFIGDGIMALFGIEGDAEAACRQALTAARSISEQLLDLNAALEGELDQPLGVAMGIHVGATIVGEMGYGGAAQITAIGDAVNIASRLEHLAKEYGVELVLSGETATRAGLNLSALPTQEIDIRGRREMLTVRMLANAAELPLSTAGRPCV